MPPVFCGEMEADDFSRARQASRRPAPAKRCTAGWPAAWAAALLASCALEPPAPALQSPGYGEGRCVGTVRDDRLNEISGMAVGRANPLVIWVHNDSRAAPRLFALDESGGLLATCHITGASARDWEDLAAFSLDGRAYLLVGDTGDNRAAVGIYSLYLIEEPVIPPDKDAQCRREVELHVPFLHRIDFRYQDLEAADCEAIAFDADRRVALLFTKVYFGPRSAGVYEIDLAPWLDRRADQTDRAATPQTAVARRSADLPIGFVTGADLSPDNRTLVLCTYGPAFQWRRGEDEAWPVALGRPAERINLPPRRQGESICFTSDGKGLYLSTEGGEAPIWRLDPRP